MKVKNQLIYIWNDLVGLKDLVLSIVLSIILTMAGFFLASGSNSTQQLFFGLIGAILAFILNTFVIKPKRIIKTQHLTDEI